MKHKIKTLATLAALSTAAIHIINKTTENKYNQKDIIKTSDDQYYEYRFGKIRYTKEGEGNPILLIHGLDTGSSSYEFHKINHKLSESHCVYTIDLLGYGLSDKPEITYTNYFYVQLIHDFIKNIIKEKVTLITSGESSTIALMTNYLNEQLVDKMIFINPQYIFDMNIIPSKQNKKMQTLYELPIYGTFAYHLIHNNERLKNKFLSEYFYDPANIKEKDIDAYMEASHIGGANNKYSFSSVENHYTNINFLQALKQNTKPILILAGTDLENSNKNIDNYKFYNTNISSHMIPNTKKLPHLENPEEVISKINDSLN